MVRKSAIFLSLLLHGLIVFSTLFDPGAIERDRGFFLNPNYFLSNLSMETKRWWEPVYEPGDFYFPDDFPPAVILIFDQSVKNITFHLEMFTGKDYMALRVYPNTSFFYIPDFPYFSFDMRLPYISYLKIESDEWSLILGRTRPKLGIWRYPVALSGVYPYLDNFTYILSGENFEYDFMVVSINPVLTKEEWKIQKSLRPVNADPTSPYYDRTKNLVFHRLEFRPLNGLVLSIAELTMVGGKCPDLFSMDPLAFLHNNFNEGYTNTMADIAAVWNFGEMWKIYFEFALDDYAVPLTEPEDVKPTAYGLTFGLIGDFKNWKVELSYVYTSRWLYNTFLPYLKFNARYLFLSNLPVPSRTIVDYPLGFEYGPDAWLIGLNLSIFRPLKMELDLAYLLKGPATIETIYKEELPEVVEDHLIFKAVAKFGNFVFSIKSVDEKFMIGGSYEMKVW